MLALDPGMPNPHLSKKKHNYPPPPVATGRHRLVVTALSDLASFWVQPTAQPKEGSRQPSARPVGFLVPTLASIILPLHGWTLADNDNLAWKMEASYMTSWCPCLWIRSIRCFLSFILQMQRHTNSTAPMPLRHWVSHQHCQPHLW
jgi:hypothetical protein